MGWSPNLFAPLCSVGNTLILNSPTTSMRKSYLLSEFVGNTFRGTAGKEWHGGNSL